MTKYLIVGDGRLSKHISHYFTLLNLPHKVWSRNKQTLPLSELASEATHILIAITDGQIENFINNHPFLRNRKLVHFSGALSLPTAVSAHPLNTFGPQLYDLDTYLKTPFVLESGRGTFADIFPGLGNPHFYIPSEKKALYHSMCVMAGNFPTLLWQNAARILGDELKLPNSILNDYIVRTLKNFLNDPSTSLTGPLARRDTQTLVRNLDALHDRPEQALYYAFINYVLEQQKIGGEVQHERLGL